MKLTQDEISKYAQAAGFEGNNLRIAAAIAMAESGGDTEAIGDEDITVGGSWGLWQVNLRWHPEYYRDPNSLHDPQKNADAAFKIFQEQGFNAWSTYKNGAYAHYLYSGPQTFMDESD